MSNILNVRILIKVFIPDDRDVYLSSLINDDDAKVVNSDNEEDTPDIGNGLGSIFSGDIFR